MCPLFVSRAHLIVVSLAALCTAGRNIAQFALKRFALGLQSCENHLGLVGLDRHSALKYKT